MNLNRTDLATILAALRYYQKNGHGDPCNRDDDIHDIATDHDDVTSLDDQGIDDLCERVNCGASERPKIYVELRGGAVQRASGNIEADVYVLDHDIDSASETAEDIFDPQKPEIGRAYIGHWPTSTEADSYDCDVLTAIAQHYAKRGGHEA